MEAAIKRLEGCMGELSAQMDNLRSTMERELEDLKHGKEKLEEEKTLFETECQRISHLIDETEQVQLCVGGYKFTTSVTTLRNEPPPSLFNAMFSGRHDIKPDKSGCYFIDRDGRHFHVILNYLRDRSFNYISENPDYKYLLELRAEAEFYGLYGLIEKLERYPYNMTRIVRASEVDPDDSWLYEDGRDEVVFSVDRNCQLLGLGLCGTVGGFTVELEVLEVSEGDFSVAVNTLSTCAQSFTKNDGQLLQMFLEKPVNLELQRYYMISALIKGTESHCCEECMETVISGGVKVTFHVWESPNGTNEQRGQFPELYIRAKN